VLRPFLLRRTKDVLEATLPSKTEVSIACPMSAYQEAMLQLLKTKGKEVQKGSVQGINNVVMEMRKVCQLFQAVCHIQLKLHIQFVQLLSQSVHSDNPNECHHEKQCLFMVINQYDML
jgi:SNF2 family DNA or RNA helicase